MRGKCFEEWEGIKIPIAGSTLITATIHVTEDLVFSSRWDVTPVTTTHDSTEHNASISILVENPETALP
jgi:hypothetical protein